MNGESEYLTIKFESTEYPPRISFQNYPSLIRKSAILFAIPNQK